MYTITTTTPRTLTIGPVTLEEIKAHLRLPTCATEDSVLTEMLTAATDMWERFSLCPTLPTVYAQHVYALNQAIILQRGNVTAIGSVQYYNTSDVLTTANSSTYYTDIVSTPASVWFTDYPQTSANKSPKGQVNFTAGWANSAAVPAPVKVAIKLLAAHWYNHREEYQDRELRRLPMGFQAVIGQFKTGILGGLM